MIYHATTNTFGLTQVELERATRHLFETIHYVRIAGGLDPAGYETPETETGRAAKTSEYCLLMAARAMGIDLGVKNERPGVLDVRQYA